ncbi:reverse transcriptase domain-containing protein [Tanacetum coccineum]
MIHSISSCHVFIPAMSAYSFTMHHLASRLPSMLWLHLIILSLLRRLRDPIDIRVDIIHLEPVAAVAFPVTTVVRTLAQQGEAIRGMQGHLLRVTIHDELISLRYRVDIVVAENASLRARIKTTEAIDKVTRNHERQARIKIEQQLATVVAVQESRRQDREDFRKFKELVTSQHAGDIMFALCVMSLNKFHADGTLSRYKARLVANGSSHLAVSSQWPIYQLDVKNAFLNGDLSKTAYMYQPSGFVMPHRLDFITVTAILLCLYVDRVLRKYALQLLECAHMVNCNPSRTPIDIESKLGPEGVPVNVVVIGLQQEVLQLPR